ncbi:hypothetical protein BU24DRAFT_491107 [Aaosphaeria arxii CBS 175.79]|uniref:Essential protein Yae1 N-terminal domain-containing protein n=1 Tax=Aaosphaeria arxii CBS 175.79 TaxID=1450172 RepID=A0A6A5XYQ8_9PLEO|nr:uncharacterized protein BU24DRAFT_491107 [Aaosphaeria arxii CBS 175.79]KAF2018063.1 hypothetical protein BU24DRAFT_491107 [Aaosphaeria arxii CBS 175.79]
MATNPTSQSHHNPTTEDPFDSLLTLEDNLYTAAYSLGVSDGAHAGRIEGRIFGLEKGFEKFASMGELHGRACVWGSRIPSLVKTPTTTASQVNDADDGQLATEGKEGKGGDGEAKGLPELKETERLRRNVSTLHGLTDPLTFSTLNTEDAVADFDDRFKRAGAKAKIIERSVSESDAQQQQQISGSQGPSSAKTAGPKKGRSVKILGETKKGKDDSMEDFSGSRFLA